METRRLLKILNCNEERRCRAHLSCKYCGEIWRKQRFKNFCDVFDSISLDGEAYYLIFKAEIIANLVEKLEKMYNFINDIRLLKKRNKLDFIYYGRLEVSFKKEKLGFFPHLNMVVFNGCYDILLQLARQHRLKVWRRRIKGGKNGVKNVVWYFLKFNNIGVERGEAVRIALNKRETIIYSKHFTKKDVNMQELAELDFRFLGVCRIRTKEEIELRKQIREERRKINKKFKEELEKIAKKYPEIYQQP